ncbi:glycosyltransferase family 39 protein [Massilia sp. YIM B04103]|uniref:glycosyltransferase family 39 protein n=1 Tax=Massilia sp. YIM B04103 TaxID=2963106 RepID=UPI00210DD19D|nr:glycosyltransferase family 39 protein [Massilia sp. YIM B04103]
MQSTLLPAAALPSGRRLSNLLIVLGLAQILIWGLAGGLAYSSTELDSAEQLVWGAAIEGGYWKHPPLPSWIMHGVLRFTDPSVALPLMMAQAAIVIALALSWRLAREFLPPAQAALSVLLTSLILYHNAGADSYNHNTALLPFQAAATLAFFLATRRDSLLYWAGAGLFAGLAILVKYVAVMPLAGLLLYLLLDRSLHHRRTLIGLLLGAAVCVLTLSPHLLWLQQNDYAPFQYAQSVVLPLQGFGAKLGSVGSFLVTQLYRVLPLLLVLALLAWRRPRERQEMLPLAQRDRLFIWIATLSPLAVTILFGLASGTRLEARWGANAFLLSGLLAVMLLRPVATAGLLKLITVLTVAVHVLLCAGLVLGKSMVAEHFGRTTRANFPAAELALATQQAWRTHTSAPLRIVATDIWLGGNLRAFGLPDIAVLIDGSHHKSPWVRREDVRNCGAMVLDDQSKDGRAGPVNPPEQLALIAGAAATGTWQLAWGNDMKQRRTVRWAYLPPQDPSRCAQ